MTREEFDRMLDYLCYEDPEFLYSEELCRVVLESILARAAGVDRELIQLSDEDVQAFLKLVLSFRDEVRKQD